MRRLIMTAVAATVVLGGLVAAVPAFAQPEVAGLRQRIRERVRIATEQRLAAALRLDAATAQRLDAVVDRYDEQIASVQRDMGQAHKQLKQYVESGGNDAATIYGFGDRILAGKAQVQKLEAARSQEVRQVLSPREYGQLIIVYPEITKQLKAEMWKAFAEHRGQGAQPAEPPPEEPLQNQ